MESLLLSPSLDEQKQADIIIESSQADCCICGRNFIKEEWFDLDIGSVSNFSTATDVFDDPSREDEYVCDRCF